MNATLTTRQLRLAGLLVLVVVVGGGYLFLSRHKTTTPTVASSTPVVTTPAQTTRSQTTPTPSKTHTRPATAGLRTHGLPVAIVRALQKHDVVVVSLTTPRGEDDQFERAEAQAGAVESGAGYVAINVFRQRPGTTILRKLGVVDTPQILVVKRPGVIYSDFKGFVDRAVVVQAVADAR
jgi:hypothetical protein